MYERVKALRDIELTTLVISVISHQCYFINLGATLLLRDFRPSPLCIVTSLLVSRKSFQQPYESLKNISRYLHLFPDLIYNKVILSGVFWIYLFSSFHANSAPLKTNIPANTFLFKVINRNTRKGVNYVQRYQNEVNDFIMVSLLLTLKIFLMLILNR